MFAAECIGRWFIQYCLAAGCWPDSPSTYHAYQDSTSALTRNLYSRWIITPSMIVTFEKSSSN